MSRRIVDPCPWCGAKVETLRGEGKPNAVAVHATPCGHKVQATVWPDRVDLDKP